MDMKPASSPQVIAVFRTGRLGSCPGASTKLFSKKGCAFSTVHHLPPTTTPNLNNVPTTFIFDDCGYPSKSDALHHPSLCDSHWCNWYFSNFFLKKRAEWTAVQISTRLIVSSGTALKNGRLQKNSPDDFYGLVEFLNIHEIDIKKYCGKSCDCFSHERKIQWLPSQGGSGE